MRQGRQETLPRELLLLLLFLGTGRWCLVLSQDSDTATARKLFGDSCTNEEDCGFEGSVCRWYRGRGRCECLENFVTDHIDKCGKAVQVNESCFFNEQCESMTPETACQDGTCQCRFDKVPVMKPDGKAECIAVVEKRKGFKFLYGDRCTLDEDCQYEGGVCGHGICGCPQGQVSNHLDKCGKAVRVNESCFFNEQCEVATPDTECRFGICRCRFERQSVTKTDGKVECVDAELRKRRDSKILFGDPCTVDEDCQFDDAVCTEHKKCECAPDLITNHLDKCGKAVQVNESCFFNEQCEAMTPETECKGDICTCRFEKQAIIRADGKVECVVIQNVIPSDKFVDPAMIGILVAMFLMFITICVVLRLFSRARWRENRTIFNTPNPRLMNVSLLRENKLLHQERRGSRSSARGPSRQPSMASLRAHSPNSQGSRRGSRGSSNASATSNRSTKSPPQAPNLSSATTPMLESVTVEVQEPKA